MITEIKKENYGGYENQYTVAIRTDKVLSKEEYSSIMDAIEVFETILGEHIKSCREAADSEKAENKKA